MPKPAELNAWNTDGSNRVVPPAGQLATGHVPEENPSSSYENWWKNITYQWSLWINDGSALASADAHIVETDGAGLISTVALEVDGDDLGGAVLVVDNASGEAASFTAGGGGSALVANGSTGSAAIVALAAGNQAAILAQGSGTAAAVQATSHGTGPGFLGIGGSGGVGIEAESDDSAGEHGLRTLTTDGSAAANTYGQYARCEDDDGTALYAEASINGSTSGAAILASGGTATGSAATAIRASIIGDGYACELLSPSSPERAPLYIRTVTADPATRQDGDVWMRGNVGSEGGMYIQERGFTRGVHATAGGFAGFLGESRATSSTTSTGFQTKITANFGGHDPKRAGVVHFEVAAEVEKSSSGNIELQIYDATAADSILERTIECDANTPRDITIKTAYTLPSAGDRTIQLRFRSTSIASGTVQIREASLSARGVF